MTTDERWIREKTLNPDMCKKCGGKCCNQCGCAFLPEDLQMCFSNLFEKIFSREITIDKLEYLENAYNKLDKPVYYLRVANVNESCVEFNGMGKCIFLTENGCKLTYENRPAGGRLLVPFWSGCYYLYTNKEFIDKWIPYQKLLKDLIEFFS